MSDRESSKTARRANADACKRYARKARSDRNVTLESIATVLHVSRQRVKQLFGSDRDQSQLSYGDLFLLARDPETAAMVRDMLAPLLEITDPQNLRLCDLDGMSRSTGTADVARMILRPTFERLFPVGQMSDTSKVKS